MKNAILSHLPGDFPWQVHWYETIDSTNTRAKIMAQQGAPHGTVLIAGHQSSGKGRMGRSFSSPAGLGLYLSVILRPGCPAKDLMHLTCAAGVAAANAIAQNCGLRPGIKWINDLVIQNRKLGGILTEMAVDAKTSVVDYAVIGIGINCLQTPSDFPPELTDIAISLKMAGYTPDIARLAADLLQSLHQMSAQLHSKEEIIRNYKDFCITIGQQIMVLAGEKKLYGTALDISEDGALLVRLSNGSVRAVNSGEVSIRGMYGYI